MCRKFAWDENKNRANQSKHGVDFGTASYVFDDPNFLSEQDKVVDGEERWQTIGLVGGFLIVSARRATAKERERYEQTTFR